MEVYTPPPRPTLGFDHGVGHPLLLLGHVNAPHCQQNKTLKDLGHSAAWPKAAEVVIKVQL
jgi:hypothetical protein